MKLIYKVTFSSTDPYRTKVKDYYFDNLNIAEKFSDKISEKYISEDSKENYKIKNVKLQDEYIKDIKTNKLKNINNSVECIETVTIRNENLKFTFSSTISIITMYTDESEFDD